MPLHVVRTFVAPVRSPQVVRQAVQIYPLVIFPLVSERQVAVHPAAQPASIRRAEPLRAWTYLPVTIIPIHLLGPAVRYSAMQVRFRLEEQVRARPVSGAVGQLLTPARALTAVLEHFPMQAHLVARVVMPVRTPPLGHQVV